MTWVYNKYLYYVFIFIFKVDFENHKFIYTPMYRYNQIMSYRICHYSYTQVIPLNTIYNSMSNKYIYPHP